MFIMMFILLKYEENHYLLRNDLEKDYSQICGNFQWLKLKKDEYNWKSNLKKTYDVEISKTLKKAFINLNMYFPI